MKFHSVQVPNFIPFVLVNSHAHMPLPFSGEMFRMHLYGQMIHTRLWVGAIPARVWVMAASTAILLPLFVMAGLFIKPHSTTYNFASAEQCFMAPSLLPSTLKVSGDNFLVKHLPKASIGSRSLLSTTTCVSLSKTPTSNSEQKLEVKSLLGFKKEVTLKVATLPELSAQKPADEPIGSRENLLFKLNTEDKTFAYQLAIAGQNTQCAMTNTEISCPLETLSLQQGTSYDYAVDRILNSEKSTAFIGKVTLLDPLVLASKNVDQEQVVYEKLDTIVLSANKPIAKVGSAILVIEGVAEPIPVTVEVNGADLSIKTSEELPRDAKFILNVSDSEAIDSAFQDEIFTLSFRTSGGPKLLGVSIGSYKVPLNSSIVLTFDVGIDASQELSRYISLQNTPTKITANGNQVTIKPLEALPACSNKTVLVSDGLRSEYGVSGVSAWSNNFRTICQVVGSIGTSVQRRSIAKYTFGNGPSKVIFVGGMHGNERSSVATLTAWIDELEHNYDKIPSDKTVIVIPNNNPDGYAVNSRINANGVDLNRNFPANDWASAVHIPGSFLEVGGGATPLSEPESSALASFISSQAPKLVLTYHATASAVFANGSGISAERAAVYAEKSGFGNYNSAHEDEVFNYPTTGEFETWLYDKKGFACILVELATMTSNEINRQKPAMWAMLD